MDQEFAELVEKFKSKPFVRRGRRVPYVLLGYMSREHQKDGTVIEKPFLHALDCTGSVGQAPMITHYVKKKGFKILDWFLPRVSDDDVQKGAIAQRSLAMKFEDDQGFAELEREILWLQGRGEERIKSLEEDKKVLEARVAQYKKEIEESRQADSTKKEKSK